MRSQSSAEPESDLVPRAIQGDVEAFGKLYDHSVERVFKAIYRRVGNAKDAEDLTQEVFLRAWKAIGTYKPSPTSPFLAWLFAIANNLVVDHYRAGRRRYRFKGQADAQAMTNVWERPSENGADRQDLRAALARLRPVEQQVVALHLLEGLSYAEIAPLVGKAPGTLRVIQHRALARLAKMMGGSKTSG